MRRAQLLAAVAVAAGSLAAAAPAAATGEPRARELDADVAPIVAGYFADPPANARRVVRALRPRRQTLPGRALLVLADALLVSGRPRAAAMVLEDVLQRDPGPDTAGWARLGLGWLALGSSDLDGAWGHFDRLAAGEWNQLLASAVLGLIAARQGRTEEAAGLLRTVAVSSAAPEAVRAVSRLGVGYALYWGGEFSRAADAFDAAAVEHPASVLADDARYGAAWALERDGNRPAAIDRLRELAMAGPGTPARDITFALVNLEPAAVLRARLRRYEGARVLSPEEQLVLALNLDGRALAAAAQRRLDGAATAPPDVQPAVAHASADDATRQPADGAAPRPAPSLPRPASPVDDAPGLPAWLFVVAAVGAALLARTMWARRRT